MITIEANNVSAACNLHVQNYGTITLSGYSLLNGTEIYFSASGNDLSFLIKELLIWNTTIA